MRPKHSARFMILLHAAMQVQWGMAKEVKNNVTQLLDLHMQFLNVNGVLLEGAEHIEQFASLLRSLKRFKADERE